MSQPAPFAYRPDIDGLRGVAVLLVVLFHAHLSCRGGFIGVDVFFVISGYLITGLMRRDLEAGGFRLTDFWERRARRILPALAVMALLTLAAGSWLLLPEDLARLGQSAMAQSLFVANLYFWRAGGGCFAGPAEQMPLLHLWSLAVEEQFYLLMPPLCLLLARLAARMPGGLVALGRRVFGGLALISLLASVWWVQHDAHSAFYWLPTRAWELLLGSLLACGPFGPAAPRLRAGVGLAGLAAILIPGLFYGADTPFPGLAALPPCRPAALPGCRPAWVPPPSSGRDVAVQRRACSSRGRSCTSVASPTRFTSGTGRCLPSRRPSVRSWSMRIRVWCASAWCWRPGVWPYCPGAGLKTPCGRG